MSAPRPSLLREGLASFAALVVIGLLKIAYNGAVGRTSGAAALGAASIALSYATLLSLFAQFAAGGAQRFVSESLGRGDDAGAAWYARAARNLTLGLGLALGALLLAAAPWLATTTSWPLLATAAALVPLHALYSYGKRQMFAYGQGARSARIEVVAAAVFALLLPLALWRDDLLLVPFVGQFAVHTAFSLRVRRAAERRSWSALLRYSSGSFVGSVAAAGVLQASVIIAGAVGGPEGAGWFAAAHSVMYLFLFLPQMLQQALFPAMSFRHGAGGAAGLKDIVAQAHGAVTLVAFAGAGVVALLADHVVALLFGPGFEAAAPLLALLVLGIALLIASIPITQAALARGASRVSAASGLLQLAAAIAVWTLGPRDVLTVPWGIVAAGAAALLLATWYALRELQLGARATLLPPAGALLALAIGFASWQAFPSWPEAAAALFVAALVAINHARIRDLAARVRRAPG